MKINKRGQGLSVNAIILIVLGVFVLAVLIIGFTIGWGTLKDKIAPSNNVKTIVDSCSVACSTNSVFDYCITSRELKAGDDSIKDITCNYLAEKQKKYGVDSCGTICDDTTRLLDDTNNLYMFENQEDLSNSETCGLDDKAKGKIIYVLNIGNDALLSLECKVTP